MFASFRLLAICLFTAFCLFGEARVRIVHASPDAPKVDILVGPAGGPPPQIAVEALPYGECTDYIPLPAGTYNAAINVSGTSNQVLALPLTVEDGGAYTVVATGFATSGKSPAFRVFAVPETRNDDPPEGAAFIRFIHAAPSAPAVSVYALPYAYATARGVDPVISVLAFGSTTGYQRVPAGTYFGRLTPAGSKTIVADAGRIALPSRAVRTVIALDTGFLILID